MEYTPAMYTNLFDNLKDCFEYDGLHDEKGLRSCE